MATPDHPAVQVDRAQPGQLACCARIRHRVFVEEQGVPLALERDGLDEACVHLIARMGNRAVGTARLRDLGKSAKAERVAVLPDLRGTGIGRALMHGLEEIARELGHREVSLHAQADAVPFYSSLGYVAMGEPFEEAGIAHRAMTKTLT